MQENSPAIAARSTGCLSHGAYWPAKRGELRGTGKEGLEAGRGVHVEAGGQPVHDEDEEDADAEQGAANRQRHVAPRVAGLLAEHGRGLETDERQQPEDDAKARRQRIRSGPERRVEVGQAVAVPGPDDGDRASSVKMNISGPSRIRSSRTEVLMLRTESVVAIASRIMPRTPHDTFQ